MSTDTPCPMCDQPIDKRATLYDSMLCQRCTAGFANRRLQAWLVDYILFLCITSVLLAPLPVYLFTNSVIPAGSESITGFMLLFIADGLKYLVLISWFTGTQLNSNALTMFIFLVIRCLCVSLIFTFRDGFAGQSPGKRLCDLVVVDPSTGSPIRFIQSFKRNVPLMIPFAGLYVLITLSKGIRLGDKQAQTRVISHSLRHLSMFSDWRYCQRCHYDLTGNTTGRCPECGTPVSSAMHASTHIDGHMKQDVADE